MDRYFFKLNKKLFDLNVMELDEVLIRFFKKIDALDTPFEMENHQGLIRKFTIDWEEGLLKGRGIKGFFAPYTAEFLTIELTNDNKIKIASDNQDIKRLSVDEIRNKEQAQTVLGALAFINKNRSTRTRLRLQWSYR